MLIQELSSRPMFTPIHSFNELVIDFSFQEKGDKEKGSRSSDGCYGKESNAASMEMYSCY